MRCVESLTAYQPMSVLRHIYEENACEVYNTHAITVQQIVHLRNLWAATF